MWWAASRRNFLFAGRKGLRPLPALRRWSGRAGSPFRPVYWARMRPTISSVSREAASVCFVVKNRAHSAPKGLSKISATSASLREITEG